jgi:hypothetical protein
MWIADQPDDIRIILGIAFADGSGVICRAVFTNDNLERHMTLLHQDGIECTADGAFLIVGEDYD